MTDDSATCSTNGVWIGSDAAGSVSMNSSTSRPLDVTLHPPLMRSTSPWENIEIRHACREARSPVRPFAAAGHEDSHVPFEVLHDGEAIRIAHEDLKNRHLEVHAPPPIDQRHIVGTRDKASRPTCLRPSGEISPLVAASRIFDATCVRAPISRWETLSQTSSRTARKSAVVAVSNMPYPRRESPTVANISHGAIQQC